MTPLCALATPLTIWPVDYIVNLLIQLVIMNHEDVNFQVSESELTCKVIGCSYFEHLVILKLSFPISELESRCEDILVLSHGPSQLCWLLNLVGSYFEHTIKSHCNMHVECL